ncbi:MAG: hypothetical protein FJ044_02495 [Candidatus Cloacimonetes bacterium]|nr:hypothetical protein [Candidatus Cloacimonadota bacterium]
MPVKAFSLLLIHFLVIFGYSISSGLYRLQGFFILIFALAIFGLLFFRENLFVQFKSSENLDNLFVFSAILSLVFSLSFYAGLYQAKGFLYNFSLFLFFVGLCLSAFYLWPKVKQTYLPRRVNLFYCFLGLALLLRLFMLLSSPNPTIDVFDILKLAPQKLIQGENPYQANYTKMFVDVATDRFAYPPGAFLATLPAVVLFGDPRLTNVIAEILSALILYVILKKKFGPNSIIAETLPVIFLFSPRALLVCEQAWLEPTILCLLLLSYFLSQHQHKVITLIIFGFLITIKQTLIFLPILLWRSLKLDLKKLGLIAFGALAVLLPFFLWSPADFYYDTITSYFSTVTQMRELINQSLTFGGFLFNTFKIEYPSFLSFLVTVPILGCILKKQGRGWSQFFLATTLFYFALFLFSTQAFLNFYYFIGQLILVNIALLPKEKEPEI